MQMPHQLPRPPPHPPHPHPPHSSPQHQLQHQLRHQRLLQLHWRLLWQKQENREPCAEELETKVDDFKAGSEARLVQHCEQAATNPSARNEESDRAVPECEPDVVGSFASHGSMCGNALLSESGLSASEIMELGDDLL